MALRTAAVCVAASMATVALAVRLRTRRMLSPKATKQNTHQGNCTKQQTSCPNNVQLADKFVVVVGLGGVGSHAAHMLVRGKHSQDENELLTDCLDLYIHVFALCFVMFCVKLESGSFV